ncbi:MAG TPA: D-alanyl-D-alanine carboxypeptidase/D-alanyl-D-alanine-endopeptidase [Candidatus Limnocylindrales bacterium]|nr:D-alanyl-D-alanine carboxypeptidase/D-alanyl-D-alanine-endopeptidase [Candidatus Limnocylindrales bacterium]
MKRLHTIGLLAVAALVAGVPATGVTAQPEDPAVVRLAAALDAILADSRLTGSQASVVVRDTTDGQTLYDRNGARRLVPASNTKLLTSTAALEILGEGYRFGTEVRTEARQSGPVLLGDLYLRGTGDPTALAADYDKLAADIAAKGVRLVTGDLIADDTYFDSQRLGTSWAWDDEPFYYSPQVSALTVAPDTDYDMGNVIVTVRPGAAAGAKPVVTLTPETGYVTIDNQASTVASGGADTISFERQHGSNRIVVTGTVPVDGSQTLDWATVWEPAGYAADVFRRALQKHGIVVLGRDKLGIATPEAARTLATHESMTLAEMMVPFLKLSNNGHAEVLVKAIGRKLSGQGTWSAGLAGMRGTLAAMGMDMSTLRQSDGSGLTRFNLVPPAEITDLLAAAKAKPWFTKWYDALPIAGNAERFVGGTLRTRMRNTPAANNVHAKTGSLTGVSGLSGYVTDADGHGLVFSILLNNYLVSGTSVKTGIEDRIAVALASFTRTAPATVGLRIAPPAEQTVPEVPDGLECSWVKPNLC